MTDTLNQFTWLVAANGYRWVMARGPIDKEPIWFLTSGVPLFGKSDWWSYAPLQATGGLFLRFAGLNPASRRAMLQFANEYGLLMRGAPPENWIEVEGQKVGHGEPLLFWSQQIRALGHAVALWMATSADPPDTALLGRFIRWKESEGVMWDAGLPGESGKPALGRRWIAARDTNPELLESFTPGDLVKPAVAQLQHLTNERLEGTRPRLLWNTSRTRLSLYQSPKDLISAMWFQLARAVDGNREYVRCSECRNYFEVGSADGGRRDKRYCGNACRARAWRKAKGVEK